MHLCAQPLHALLAAEKGFEWEFARALVFLMADFVSPLPRQESH